MDISKFLHTIHTDSADSLNAESLFRNYNFTNTEVCGDFIKHHFPDTRGSGQGTTLCYEVMPGICMTYDELHMKSCFQQIGHLPDYLQINYCFEGCFEFELHNRQVTFLGEGDMCVSNPGNLDFADTRLPLEFYRGIAFIIKMEEAQCSLDDFFPQSGIRLDQLTQVLFKKQSACLYHSLPEISQLFAALYHVDRRIMKPYVATKMIELLLLLQLMQEQGAPQIPRFSQNVVNRTKKVHHYLMTHPGEKFCVQNLANRFCIAESSLQQCFKNIYGKPIASFVRQQRMQNSALLLKEQPDLSIGEIAQMAGYENQSKFASAFKSVIGMPPLAYRRSVMEASDLSFD